MDILISGFCGKMGQTVFNCSKNFVNINVVNGFDRQEAIDDYRCELTTGTTLISDLNNAKKCDVVIDFSHVSNLKNILNYCVNTNTALVLATTGLSNEDEKLVEDCAKKIAIFKSSNMSEGIYVLLSLIKKAVPMLEGWDIEIIEKHHNLKKDSPSGTAKMMLNEIKACKSNINPVYGRNLQSGKREANDIGVHAVRGGGVVGEHEINFFSENETIKISHEAFSKSIFAEGALKASEFICGKKPGIYTMKNLFE